MKVKAITPFKYLDLNFDIDKTYEVGVDITFNVYNVIKKNFTVVEDATPFRNVRTKIVNNIQTK